MYANGPKIVTDGLTLCLDAGNTKSYLGSGTSWVDISRNGNSGTLINGPTFNSDNIGSIVFDGANDYVAIPPSSLVSGSQMTFAVWNFGVSGQDATSIIYFESPTIYRVLNVHLTWYGQFIFFDAGNGSGNIGNWDRIYKSVTAAEHEGWNYWVFTKNSTAGTMRIYRNGKLWHSGTGCNAPIGAATSGSLGASSSNGYYHKGRIAMAKLYSRELSESEILQNYNATKGRFKL